MLCELYFGCSGPGASNQNSWVNFILVSPLYLGDMYFLIVTAVTGSVSITKSKQEDVIPFSFEKHTLALSLRCPCYALLDDKSFAATREKHISPLAWRELYLPYIWEEIFSGCLTHHYRCLQEGWEKGGGGGWVWAERVIGNLVVQWSGKCCPLAES